MSLIILEGLDRTGKSSVASHYEKQGYEVVHVSAPAKGLTADLFIEEQMQLISSAATRDVLLDRSYYGELVWPVVYNREPLVAEEALEALRELELSVGTTRILMHDPNVDAHWKRCVDNKEPLTKGQFVKARGLYSALAETYGFQKKTLKDFPQIAITESVVEIQQNVPAASEQLKPAVKPVALSKEQVKLETANAISDVLSKRIIKSKGLIYDQLENNLRVFLNAELGKILGTKSEVGSFTNEEVTLLKFFCGRLKEKDKER